MDIAEHITCLAREGRSLAAAADRAGPEARIPACEGWRIRDLLRHTGLIHRWATAFVTEGHTSYHPVAGEPGPDGDALVEWFRQGHERLVSALRAAPADLTCWTFLPAPSPLAFWARRQAHETAVHRSDAESALGGGATAGHAGLAAAFAADGVDELLRGFHGRRKSRVRADTPGVLRVRATDTGDVWTVRISPEPPATTRGGDDPADCELSGDAERLRLTLWNRLPLSAVTLTGDPELALLWRERSAVI